jgi:hypothetical protein
MTTLNLVELWIAPADDLSDTLHLRIRDESETTAAPATIRRYAGGRDRLVSRPGETRAVTVKALNVDRDDYLELQERIGTVQLFREPRGRRIWGIIQSVTGVEWRARADTLGDVSFTYTSVTVSEVV